MSTEAAGANPLVAKPPEGPSDWQGKLNTATAGSGALSDAAATIGDVSKGDWGAAGIDVVNDGLDLLGAAMNPLGALASAGVGWLIEHIEFLKDGMDKLAGNPEVITAHSQTWTNISNQLKQSASQYQGAKSGLLQTYKCASAQGYDRTGEQFVSVLHGAADEASSAAKAMQVGGALVGAERAIIRDMISEFVGGLIVKALAALATSWCSFGGTIAAFIADTLVEGGILAEKISTRIAKVIKQLDKLASGAGKSSKSLEKLSGALKKFKGKADDLTNTSVDKAVQLENKGVDLKAEGAANKAEYKAKDPSNSAAQNRADGWNHTPEAGEKGALDLGNWVHAGAGKLAHNADAHAPRWTSADAVAATQEAGRQSNEQPARAEGTDASYEQVHPGKAEELKKYKDYQWPTEEPS